MDEFLLKFLSDDDFKDKIEYNKKIKELNKILDKILYLCNNISYKRIKNLYINIIENYNYYNEKEGSSNFDSIDTKETEDNDENIKKIYEEIEKQIFNFEKEYNEFKELEYYKKDNIKDFQYQNNYLINKLNNIISTLNMLDEKDKKVDKGEKETIHFNIYLINKDSLAYIFIGYHILKNVLFKNSHFIKVNDINDTKKENEEENEEENKILEINEKLNKIYITYFNERLKTLKDKIEDIKDKIEGLKKNIPNGKSLLIDIPIARPVDDDIPIARPVDDDIPIARPLYVN